MVENAAPPAKNDVGIIFARHVSMEKFSVNHDSWPCDEHE